MKKNNKNILLSLFTIISVTIGCSNSNIRKPSNEELQAEQTIIEKNQILLRQRADLEPERNRQCKSDRTKIKHYIFFVHGYKGNENTFGSMPEVFAQQLNLLKPEECVITFRLSYSTGDNEKSVFDFAQQINEQIQSKILNRELNYDPKNKISFVTHSQGGLLTAISLQRAIIDAENIHLSKYIPLVKNFITLGTPFWGSWIAELADRNTGKKALQIIDWINNDKPMGKKELADMSYGSENIYNLHNWWRTFKLKMDELIEKSKKSLPEGKKFNPEEFRILNIAGLFPELEPVSLEIHSVLSKKLLEKSLDPKLFFINTPGTIYLNVTLLSKIKDSKEILDSINTDPKQKQSFREKFHAVFFPGALRWEGDTLVNATSARWNFIYYNSKNPSKNLNTEDILVKNSYEMIQALHASPWASQYYDEVEAPEVCFNKDEGVKYCDHPGLMWTLKQLANCENTNCNKNAVDAIKQSPKNFKVIAAESNHYKSQMRYFQLQVNINLPENYIVDQNLIKALVNNGKIVETMYENVNQKDIFFHDLRLASKDLKKTAIDDLSLLKNSLWPISFYKRWQKNGDAAVENIDEYRVGLDAEVIQNNPEIKLELARLTEAFSYDVKFLPSKSADEVNPARGPRVLVTVRGRILARSNPYMDPLPPDVLENGVKIPIQIKMPCDVHNLCPNASKVMKVTLKPAWLTWMDVDLSKK